MHELSFILDIVDQIEALKRQEHFSQVKQIHLEVGEQSGIQKQALEFAAAEGFDKTCLEGAKLRVTLTQGADLRICDLEVFDS